MKNEVTEIWVKASDAEWTKPSQEEGRATEEMWLLIKDRWGGAGKWSEPGLNSGVQKKKSINQKPGRQKNQKSHNTEIKSSENRAQDKEVILDCQGMFALVFLFGPEI